MPREPGLAEFGVFLLLEQVFLIGVRNSGQVALRRSVKSLGPWKCTSVHLGTLDGWSTQRLAVGRSTHNILLIHTELVEVVILSGEAEGSSDSQAKSMEVTLAGIQSQGDRQDLKRILRHAWEDVEERLAVSAVVSEEDIRLSGSDERVAREENVEQTDAD